MMFYTLYNGREGGKQANDVSGRVTSRREVHVDRLVQGMRNYCWLHCAHTPCLSAGGMSSTKGEKRRFPKFRKLSRGELKGRSQVQSASSSSQLVS